MGRPEEELRGEVVLRFYEDSTIVDDVAAWSVGIVGLPGVAGFTFESPRPTLACESLSSRNTLRKPLQQRTYRARLVGTFGPLPSVCPAVSLLLRSNAQPDLPCALLLDDAGLLCRRRIRERQSIDKLCSRARRSVAPFHHNWIFHAVFQNDTVLHIYIYIYVSIRRGGKNLTSLWNCVCKNVVRAHAGALFIFKFSLFI